ncbi:MAG: hypothetical protein KBC07_02510 [Bacteroidales bacterium]|jgi:hypothetical protein|nr:hypothetical protein [Bacteroidales bacterium]NLH23656.1 hypothetical protein [Bacteroidales bacterium]
MRAVVDEHLKKEIKKALKTGKINLLVIPELALMLSDYVEAMQQMKEIVTAAIQAEGKTIEDYNIEVPVVASDRESWLVMLKGLQDGQMDIPKSWVDQAAQINKRSPFLDVMVAASMMDHKIR